MMSAFPSGITSAKIGSLLKSKLPKKLLAKKPKKKSENVLKKRRKNAQKKKQRVLRKPVVLRRLRVPPRHPQNTTRRSPTQPQ